MRFEYNVKVSRVVDDEISIILDAEDEIEAEESVIELLGADQTDLQARRFFVLSRRFHEPDNIDIQRVLHEEPEGGPQYA